MKKILIATAALTLMCGSAFAQSGTGPAPQGDTMNKPGMSNGSMDNGAMKKGSMHTGTTGSAMKPDASQQGAPTGAAVNSMGSSTEPGKVKDGASR